MESVFHTFFELRNFLGHSRSAVVAQNVSFMLVRQILNRDTGLWLDELKKILFRMINTACLFQDLECAFVREKNGVTAPVGACKVFLRLRCFAQHFCVSLTHTHLSELSLSPSHDDLWRRDSSCPVNMPGNRHGNILNTTTSGSSCCRLQWQLLLSFYTHESLSYCSRTSQDFSHTKAMVLIARKCPGKCTSAFQKNPQILLSELS